MTNFFDLSALGLQTSQGELLAGWLQQMQLNFPGYNPAPTNPEYVDASIFASQLADVANLCSAGSDELFRQFGLQLIGLPIQLGTPAIATATVTAIDTNGPYTLPAATQLTLTLNGTQVAFQTQQPLTIPNGQTTGTVQVQAAVPGVAANGATNPCSLVSQITWVSGITVAAAANNGVDPETDDAYLQRLAATLTTLAPRPITAADYATLALDFVPAAGTDQQEVGRATAIDGFEPGPQTFVGNVTISSPTVTVTTPPGPGIVAFPTAAVASTADTPASTVLASPAPTSSQFTLANNATATATGVSFSVSGSTSNERTITLAITDANGNNLNSDTLTAVAEYLEALRELNFVVHVVSPSNPLIYVSVTVKAAPGFVASTVQANVQAAILSFLSPQNFGLPQGAIVGWNNSTTIWASRLTSAIQLASGVDHIVGDPAFGTSASPSNTTDLLLPGPFVLPTSTSTSVPLTAITVT